MLTNNGNCRKTSIYNHENGLVRAQSRTQIPYLQLGTKIIHIFNVEVPTLWLLTVGCTMTSHIY